MCLNDSIYELYLAGASVSSPALAGSTPPVDSCA